MERRRNLTLSLEAKISPLFVLYFEPIGLKIQTIFNQEYSYIYEGRSQHSRLSETSHLNIPKLSLFSLIQMHVT